MSKILKGKTIMWVEDDNFLGSVITKKMTTEDANIVYLDTGAKALEELKELVPDLVLLDVLLPDKDGFEVLEEIRKNERLKNIPVILFSNLSQEDNINKAKELGATDFYVKSSFTPDEIIEKIKLFFA